MSSSPAPILQPAHWRLLPGSGGSVGVRWAGHLLIAFSSATMLAWCVSLWRDAWLLQEWGSREFMASVLACGWGAHALSLWRQWARPPAPVTLRWTGAWRQDPDAPQAAPKGGWRVTQWGDDAVRVSLVFDAQHLLLIHVSQDVAPHASPQTPPHSAWFWLSARHTPELHRMRTLLALPLELTDPASRQRQQLMASSAHTSKQGHRVRVAAFHRLLSALQRPRSATSAGASAYAPTQWMPRPDDEVDADDPIAVKQGQP